MKTKICTNSKCGKELSATTEYWYRRKNGKFGLHARCKECMNEYQKQYHIDNKEKKSEYDKQWHIDNKEERSKYLKQYHIDNKEQRNEYNKQWAKDNSGKVNANTVKRRAKQLDQTPPNANKELISFYYEVASTMVDYEIDHIKPLSKGGLHHEDNLQILLKKLNREKLAKWPLTEKGQRRYKGIKL